MSKFTHQLIYIPRTTSTMDEARQVAGRNRREKTAGFTAVWAGRQSHGRGRLGRRWQSSANNLMATIILRPENLHQNASHLPHIVALSVLEALSPWLPEEDSRIKWPNDILVTDRKLAGILIETDPVSRASLVGIGVNVGETPRLVSTDRAGLFPPVSVRELAGRENVGNENKEENKGEKIGVREILIRILDVLERKCVCWRRDGFEGKLMQTYQAVLWRRGEEIEVSGNREKSRFLRGINRGISTDGSLLLEISGELRRIYAGDVGI